MKHDFNLPYVPSPSSSAFPSSTTNSASLTGLELIFCIVVFSFVSSPWCCGGCGWHGDSTLATLASELVRWKRGGGDAAWVECARRRLPGGGGVGADTNNVISSAVAAAAAAADAAFKFFLG